SLRVALSRIGKRVVLSPSQITRTMRRHEQSPNRPAVLFVDAPFDVVSVLEEHRVEFPGIVIQSAPRRYYPDSEAVSGFIGYTNEIGEAQLNSDAGAGYKSGQQVGVAGLEREYESALRGREGSRFVEVDSRQRVVRDAGVRAELPPVAGTTLRTN